MPDAPIQLPGLAAERQPPSAAVCQSGHVLAWHVDPSLVPPFCPKCGERVLVACPACGAALPANEDQLEWIPYHANCVQCGAPYPWKTADVERAKRAVAEQAEVDRWDDALRARADELIADISADRAAPAGVRAGLRWLAAHAGDDATEAILDLIDRLPQPELKRALRSTYPDRFR